MNSLTRFPLSLAMYCQAETQARELVWQKEDSVELDLDHNWIR